MGGGGAPTSLFSMLGLGQWVTPSSRFLAGKDGTVMIPQQMLVPCVVQVGDEAETRSPKPLSLLCGPPGGAGEGLADEISNPAGVARGKERGQGLAAGSHSSNSTACLSGVFCASPSQIRRFVTRDVQAVPCRGSVVRDQGEQVAFVGHRFIHSFPPEQDFRLDLSWLACAPTAVGGVTWGLAAFGGVSG